MKCSQVWDKVYDKKWLSQPDFKNNNKRYEFIDSACLNGKTVCNAFILIAFNSSAIYY